MDISIEKLNANNYSTWKEDVKVVLMEKGSWRIITEEEKVPHKLSGIEGEEERTYQKLLKDCSFRKDRAYSVIYLSSEKEYRLLIAGIEDPVKAWKILEEHFRPDSRARAIGLTDEFFSCRVCPDEDIGIYAARLKHISAQLADCDKPIKDWYHAFQLIRYLPPEYAGIVQAIYRWKDEDFKADKVLSELLAEEARLKQSNKDQEVLACQAKTNSSRPIKVITRKIPSGNHDQVELTSKVKGRQRKNQKRRPRSFSRKRQNTSLVTDANASATTSLPPGTWIFDTAATSHFSCDKDSMLNYRPVKGAEVSVAIGGVTCPVEGTGEVELEFYKNGKIRSNKPLELLPMDLCGPIQNVAIGGYRYFLTITDDYSRKVNVYPVKEKRDVFKCFRSHQNRVERYLNSKIISIRTDNGLEFCNSEFEVLLEEQGIKVERTNTYTTEQNGVSERYNYTAMDCVKAMLNDSGLGNHFWVEALFCFTYVWNRVCHGKQKLTPLELFCGNKPSVKHLKIFGAAAFLGVPKQQRRKLDTRAKKGIMVGYAQRTRGYRIWLPSDRKIIESINVNFDEDVGDRSGAVLDPPKTVSLKFDNPASNTDSDRESNKSYSDSDDSSVKSEFKMETKSGESQSVSPMKFSLVRTAIPRKKGSRTDIYYYVSGSKTRLRSHEDVRKFCESNNLSYDGKLFDFSGKNTCTEEIKLEPTEVNISQTNVSKI
ncbi:Retrovirus-related Pol polyprotein from transposon TNT 1-94 [Araneus ventricosus]|uniref:Retrovirus-related Pol polyprotein from transposon TNT 1-94 n=1 Tax=Araneus ventricosus TaxID=182803 RepID=A0A4Y2I1S7_ARAVE|nr:Retrovirus-related Pol polyprotein from transposon TNT 1-94 [Araneus ventricosus]